MKRPKKHFFVFMVSVLPLSLSITNAQELTAQEIVNSVINKLDSINDLTADFDVETDSIEIDDMSNGFLQWKDSNNTRKFKLVEGYPYTRTRKTDGSGKWNVTDPYYHYDYIYFPPKANYETQMHNETGIDMFNMEQILKNEIWTRDSNITMTNSISCYRIYTTKNTNNYEVWVDEPTRTKILRVKETDCEDSLRWQLDYYNYSNVESIVPIPTTIVIKKYVNNKISAKCKYTFYDININENIDDSIFHVNIPEGF